VRAFTSHHNVVVARTEDPLKLPARQIVATDSALGKGMDFAFTLALFFGIGFALDRWLGTTPLFMILLSVAAIIGLTYRIWTKYEAEMQAHDDARKQALQQAGRR
jgi:F0F1-type ATP synthase assembly protein I